MSAKMLAIDPGTGALQADEAEFHILRPGPVYDPKSGELVIDITDELCRDVVAGFEALGGRWTVPFDLDHGLQRGKTPEEKQTYGAALGFEYREGEGVFAKPALNAQGTSLLGNNPDTYFISPVIHPRPLHDPDTGERIAEAWVESLSFTGLPRQTRLAPAALSRAGLGEDARPMLLLARFESADEHRQRLANAVRKLLKTDDNWTYLEDWNDEHAIVCVSPRDDDGSYLVRVPYELRDGGELLLGEAQRVRKVITYVPDPPVPQGAGLSRTTGSPPEGAPMSEKSQPTPGAGKPSSAQGDQITLSRAEHDEKAALLSRLETENAALLAREKARAEAELVAKRDTLLARAVEDGRIGAEQLDEYRADFDAAPEVTERLLGRLQPKDERVRTLEAEQLLSRAMDEGKIVAADREAWLDDLVKTPEATKRALSRIPAGKVAPTTPPKGTGSDEGRSDLSKLSPAQQKLALAREVDAYAVEHKVDEGAALTAVLSRYETAEKKGVAL